MAQNQAQNVNYSIFEIYPCYKFFSLVTNFRCAIFYVSKCTSAMIIKMFRKDNIISFQYYWMAGYVRVFSITFELILF